MDVPRIGVMLISAAARLNEKAVLMRSRESHVKDSGESPNDPKLSDRRSGRGTCMVGGKVVVEAGAVTAEPVRCSAWLGVSGRIGVGAGGGNLG